MKKQREQLIFDKEIVEEEVPWQILNLPCR